MLRHVLATLAYRAGKALRGAGPEFARFSAGEGVRTPVEILAHMSDLLDWALSYTLDAPVWVAKPAGEWEAEVARFHAALETLDERLAAAEPLKVSQERLFQGPLADALTHTGQLTMLRRMATAPVRPENYFQASITTGRVGADQAAPNREF
ncbi:MAG: hypothetical protein NTZ56_22960 [Acidobacteria bacterium]|nr:hypothetical protein [Acidobacteriota bacterium]